jgi:hypothetical protein
MSSCRVAGIHGPTEAVNGAEKAPRVKNEAKRDGEVCRILCRDEDGLDVGWDGMGRGTTRGWRAAFLREGQEMAAGKETAAAPRRAGGLLLPSLRLRDSEQANHWQTPSERPITLRNRF